MSTIDNIMLLLAYLLAAGVACLATYSAWLTATGRPTISAWMHRRTPRQAAIASALVTFPVALAIGILIGHFWPVGG